MAMILSCCYCDVPLLLHRFMGAAIPVGSTMIGGQVAK